MHQVMVIKVITNDSGPGKFVHYNRAFVINEFVINKTIVFTLKFWQIQRKFHLIYSAWINSDVIFRPPLCTLSRSIWPSDFLSEASSPAASSSSTASPSSENGGSSELKRKQIHSTPATTTTSTSRSIYLRESGFLWIRIFRKSYGKIWFWLIL